MDEEKRDKAYKNLANAIVLRAVEDYREAILYNDNKTIEECERFFKSKWCAFLAGMDGKHLAEKLKTETIYFRDQAFKIFDEKQHNNDTNKDEKAFKCPTCGEFVEITFGNISRQAKTKGYIAICRSCGLNVKRRIDGDLTRRNWKY